MIIQFLIVRYWRENKYDRMGRKVNDRVLREDGSGGTNTIVPYRTSDTEFTAGGQVKREYDRVNSGSGENWEYSYDLQGRLTQVKDPEVDDPNSSGTVRYTEDYTYGFAGNLLETEDRRNNKKTTDYDKAGRKLSETTFGQGYSTDFRYNRNGWMREQTNPSGSTETIEFDARGVQKKHKRTGLSRHQPCPGERKECLTGLLP